MRGEEVVGVVGEDFKGDGAVVTGAFQGADEAFPVEAARAEGEMIVRAAAVVREVGVDNALPEGGEEFVRAVAAHLGVGDIEVEADCRVRVQHSAQVGDGGEVLRDVLDHQP